jgi:hypothetical protein
MVKDNEERLKSLDNVVISGATSVDKSPKEGFVDVPTLVKFSDRTLRGSLEYDPEQ